MLKHITRILGKQIIARILVHMYKYVHSAWAHKWEVINQGFLCDVCAVNEIK